MPISSRTRALLLLAALAVAPSAGAQTSQPAARSSTQPAQSTQPANLPETPAARWVARGEQMIARQPDQVAGYNVKALGYCHLARENGDADNYRISLEVLEKSFELEPDNFEGLKVKAWALLGQHRFREARDLAASLNERVPDDLYAYAFLTDANVALGDYDAAEKAAQVLLDLRPNSSPALTRGALLRNLFGDPQGALEFYGKAYQVTPADEPAERAWVLTRAARVALGGGRIEAAEQFAGAARKEFPDYAPAIAAAADVKEAVAAGLAAAVPSDAAREEAIALRRKVVDLEPNLPEHWYALAETLRRARGSADDAYARFRELAEARGNQPDNANALLVRYLAGPGNDPAAAVALARSEVERRQDVETLDAAAVALLADGKPDEARRLIDRALAVGIKSAEVFYHAGRIAAAQEFAGSHGEAVDFLSKAIEASSGSNVWLDALRLRGELMNDSTTRAVTNP